MRRTPWRPRLKDLGAQAQIADTATNRRWSGRRARRAWGCLILRPIEEAGVLHRGLRHSSRELGLLCEGNPEGDGCARCRGRYLRHASAGCLHIRPVLDLKSGRGIRDLRAIAEETVRLTLRLGGAMSSEHGDGIARGNGFGRRMARSLQSRCSPSSAPRIRWHSESAQDAGCSRHGHAASLRATYQTRAWVPGIRFGDPGGLTTAIEQCNGQGVCAEKKPA